MQLIEAKRKMRPIILVSFCLVVASCTSLIQPTPTFPEKLNVTILSDGGLCMDAESAKRLAEFKADLEAL